MRECSNIAEDLDIESEQSLCEVLQDLGSKVISWLTIQPVTSSHTSSNVFHTLLSVMQ